MAIESFKKKSSIKISNSYECILSLIATFDQNSVYSHIQLESQRFKRFFMTWEATKALYLNNRKFISVDGTFLSGPNKGTLLTAVAQDGKDQLVLLAFAIVESENSSSWKYFLENLNEHFNINTSSTIIMSDRDSGLLSIIEDVCPEKVVYHCAKHICVPFVQGAAVV